MSKHRMVHASVGVRRGGFTLSELLIVLGIIVLLLSILLPAITRARRQALAVKCQSNVRQICVALIAYSGANNGFSPPNKDSIQAYWCDARLDSYLPGLHLQGVNLVGSAVTCPEDEGGCRSYGMNIFASSDIDQTNANVPIASLWPKAVPRPSQMLLVVETWSYQGTPVGGYYANPYAGSMWPTSLGRFGGGLPIANLPRRFGSSLTELAFGRHLGNPPSANIVPSRGMLNFGFADGHVELLSAGDFVDFATGQLSGRGGWTTADVNAP